MRIKSGWLAIIGVSILQAACHEHFPPCPFPGAIGPQNTCHYVLQIKSVDEASGHVTATIHPSVVEENRQRNTLRQVIPDYQMEDYPFYQYVFHVRPSDMTTLSQLTKDPKRSEEPVAFVSTPGDHVLKLEKTDMAVSR